MKKLISLSIALALGGCASMPAPSPVVHAAPKPVVAVPAPTPVVVAPPESPVTVTKLGKPRWYDEFKSGAGKVKSHFNKKGN